MTLCNIGWKLFGIWSWAFLLIMKYFIHFHFAVISSMYFQINSLNYLIMITKLIHQYTVLYKALLIIIIKYSFYLWVWSEVIFQSIKSKHLIGSDFFELTYQIALLSLLVMTSLECCSMWRFGFMTIDWPIGLKLYPQACVLNSPSVPYVCLYKLWHVGDIVLK